MRKIVFPAMLLLSVAIATGCNKKVESTCGTVTTTAPASEVDSVRKYIADNNITATYDDRGFYYFITNPGTGKHPTQCSQVKVTYIGKLTNGSVFDSNNSVYLSMANLITGWKEGLPLIAEGGRITLIIPPSLGYGATANSRIPANSILLFTIDLQTIQ